jgi:hypothetical protein
MRVTDGQGTEAEPGEQDGQERPGGKRRWRDRPSIRVLEQEARSAWAGSDRRENEASRLPDTDVNGHWEILLGGLVFSGLAATSFPGWWPRVLPAGGG